MTISSPVPTAQDLQGLIFPLQLDLNEKLVIKPEHLKFILHSKYFVFNGK